MERGEAANLMLMAAARGRTFEEAGVPDTPGNRELYAKMLSEIDSFPEGSVVEVPGE
jgi:hypothetical protein